jgi:hypothetical protein
VCLSVCLHNSAVESYLVPFKPFKEKISKFKAKT